MYKKNSIYLKQFFKFSALCYVPFATKKTLLKKISMKYTNCYGNTAKTEPFATDQSLPKPPFPTAHSQQPSNTKCPILSPGGGGVGVNAMKLQKKKTRQFLF